MPTHVRFCPILANLPTYSKIGHHLWTAFGFFCCLHVSTFSMTAVVINFLLCSLKLLNCCYHNGLWTVCIVITEGYYKCGPYYYRNSVLLLQKVGLIITEEFSDLLLHTVGLIIGTQIFQL